MVQFPTIYFYETGYSLHTLRQASRRWWRIGQRFDVRVKFLIYDETTQRTCLRLMGRKMLVALMMEGKFPGEGIHSMDADDDLLAAMAQEFVARGGIGESADAVWAEFKRERTAYAGATPQQPPARDLADTPVSEDLFGVAALTERTAAPGPVLVESKPKPREVKPRLADRIRRRITAAALRLSEREPSRVRSGRGPFWQITTHQPSQMAPSLSARRRHQFRREP